MTTSVEQFKQKIVKKAAASAPVTTTIAPLPNSSNQPHKGINFGIIDTSARPDNVIIVGSGLSLTGFHLTRLKGAGFIITVNDTGNEVLFADAWITIDPWGLDGPQLPPSSFMGKLYAGVSDDYNTPSCKIVKGNKIDDRITFVRRLSRTNNPDARREHSFYYRLSEDPACVATGNSGYAAFNLAYILRPKKILLLGIDGGNGYFFTNRKTNKSLHGLNDLFASSLPQITQAGIEVINGSVNSTVTCFPRYTIETALSKL